MVRVPMMEGGNDLGDAAAHVGLVGAAGGLVLGQLRHHGVVPLLLEALLHHRGKGAMNIPVQKPLGTQMTVKALFCLRCSWNTY